MFNILVVEDDKSTAKLISAVLRRNGYEVFNSENGLEALDLIDQQHIDLIILDVMMPKMNGYQFTKEIRSSKVQTPILMVTSKYLISDKKEAFSNGVDDFLVKPFNEEELILRTKALLRRCGLVNEHILEIGNVTLDYDQLTVTKGTITIEFTKKEFYLLYKLVSNKNKIFTRLQILDEIWGMDTDSTNATIDVHINRIRKKLELVPEIEIITIRGVGYKAALNEK